MEHRREHAIDEGAYVKYKNTFIFIRIGKEINLTIGWDLV